MDIPSKFIKILALACLLTLFQGQHLYAGKESEQTSLIVDAYNHLTVGFAVVREGLNADRVRKDILGNVRLALLPKEIQNLYRSLLALCNKSIALKRKLTESKSAIEKKTSNEREEKALRTLVHLGTTYFTGNFQLGLPALFDLLFSKNQEEDFAEDLDVASSLKEELAEETSSFEFEISLARSNLLEKYEIDERRFISTADLEEYLDLLQQKTDPATYYQALTRIYRRSPSMYFIAYELGLFFYKQGKLEKAKEYLHEALQKTPKIITRSPIRTNSLALLGMIQVQEGSLQAALEKIRLALEEDPGNITALVGRATILHKKKRYLEAKAAYEEIFEIEPDHPIARYNYACVLARLGKEKTVVLAELRRAFNSGFNQIKYVRNDPELSYLKEDDDFKSLLEIDLKVKIDWHALEPDEIIITNNSEFDLTNVTVFGAFKNNDLTGWRTIEKVVISKLAHGEQIRFPGIGSTKTLLKYLRLELTADQGTVRMLFKNSYGTLMRLEP